MVDVLNTLAEQMARGLVLLDGGTGTEVERRDLPQSDELWSARALLDDPDGVAAIHADYVAAGADIVVANTFRTNPRALAAAGLAQQGGAINQQAVNLVRQAISGAPAAASRRWPILVAGSLAPVEDCYAPEAVPDEATLRAEHGQLARWLADAGVDLLWIETMNCVREARTATQIARELELPFVVSFVPAEGGALLSGETLADAVAAVEPAAPLAIGLNCIPPSGMTNLLPRLRELTERPLVAYAHVHDGPPIRGWSYAELLDPQAYAEIAIRWCEQGARIVGGCCGTTPEHIVRLRAALTAS
jgi:S-methylmethionine-dependent homocysteine/selenocysteine methylase